MTETVTLSAGAATAEIVGGDLLSIRSLRHGDEELLVGPAELPAGYCVHGSAAGITLLHPWANRLGADRYAFAGQPARLDRAGDRVTRDANGLAIHGITAPHPWRLTQDHPDTAAASLTWLAEPGFPFAHQIGVRFALAGDTGGDTNPDAGTGFTLTIDTTVTPLADGPVPVALGWHPYFQRQDPAQLSLPALSRLEADARGLPTGAAIPQAATRIDLAGENLDFGVSGLASGSQMQLHTPRRTITVALGPGYTFGQIFAPPDAPVVSLEPMTAPTDALGAGTNLPVADGEQPYVATFVIEVMAGGSA